MREPSRSGRVGGLGGSAELRAQAEELGVGHQRSGRALVKHRERGRESVTRRGTDANLRHSAEIGDRKPPALELPKPHPDLDAEVRRGDPAVHADGSRLLIHAQIVTSDRDSSPVATQETVADSGLSDGRTRLAGAAICSTRYAA